MSSSRVIIAFVLATAVAAPDEIVTSLARPVGTAPQPDPDGYASAADAAEDTVLSGEAELAAARRLVRGLSAHLVVNNATQLAEESWVGGEFTIPSEQRLDIVALRGHGATLLLSVATKSNVGTGLVKATALHLRAATGWQRIVQTLQLFGEGADEVRDCERGHHLAPSAVAALREGIGPAGEGLGVAS